MLRLIALLMVLLVACSGEKGPEENVLLSPGGGKAHWGATDFPAVLLVGANLPVKVMKEITSCILEINAGVGNTVIVSQLVDARDPRLNGGIVYGQHSLVLEEGRSDWRANTTVVYLKGDAGYKDGKLFSVETSVGTDTPDKSLHKVILHELLHQFGLGHSKSKDDVLYRAAEASSGKMSDFEKNYIRSQYLGSF